MTDFRKPVGTAGNMLIRDDGWNVQYWIECSDPATNVGNYSWSGVVNGVNVGGSVALPAGFGARMLGQWAVPFSQVVTFHQNPTGTSGLGGAADHSAPIDRGPVATVPGKPAPVVLDQVTPTGMRVTYHDPPDGGSTITSRALQVAQNPQFTGATNTIPVNQSGIYLATDLLPAYPFWWRYRVQNAVGVSEWSDPVLAYTTGFVWGDDGSTFNRYAVDISDGAAWARQIVEISDGAAWQVGG